MSPIETAALGRAEGRGNTRRLWPAILAVALAARLAFALLLPPDFIFSDTIDYDRMARGIVDHGTFGSFPLRPPGYPVFMAGVYLVFGKSVLAIRLVEVVIGTVSVGLIGLLGTRLFGAGAGLLAGAIAALHPVMAFLPSALYTENLLIFFIVLALIQAFEGARRGSIGRWIACGVLFGVALLIRPNVVAMLPGLGLGFAFLLARERRRWLTPALATFVALILTLLPWEARNHHVYGHWYFVSNGGGRQFFAGNNPTATGETTFHPDFDAETWKEMLRQPDWYAMDQYLYRRGWQFIREHPARAAHLYLIELGNLYALHPETVTRTLMNQWSRVSQSIASLFIYAGVLIGLTRWRRMPALWPLTLSIVTFSLANALVYSSMRYRMVFEPCLILMAGFGWSSLLAWRAHERPVERAA
ncbi:MAG TPA: glycosyltransferase family 39 protein [Candidatus Udaeobacter sp.]|jgi:4-amino-4-deoxy-L-arabinose transferase-like glycosyltransferase|nr:glycosyltransferase family 39 protein [Candidatus Udaeobacter sp.]